MKTLSGLVCVLGGLILILSLSACCQCGLGKVPTSLVELYDQAKVDGAMELELNRCGCIVEMEADIEVDDLPAFVKEAAMLRAPGAVITGGEREIQAAGEAWEVKLRFEDRNWEFVVGQDGSIQETEKELRREEAPAAVLTAAAEAVPGAEFKSVEVIEKVLGDTEYHVKQTRGGASYKVVLTEAGEVKRAVREARAEIEIPLN